MKQAVAARGPVDHPDRQCRQRDSACRSPRLRPISSATCSSSTCWACVHPAQAVLGGMIERGFGRIVVGRLDRRAARATPTCRAYTHGQARRRRLGARARAGDREDRRHRQRRLPRLRRHRPRPRAARRGWSTKTGRARRMRSRDSCSRATRRPADHARRRSPRPCCISVRPAAAAITGATLRDRGGRAA